MSVSYTQEQIDAALVAGSRRWSFRHEIIASDGALLGAADVSDMSVANNDLADKVKRTCSLRLASSTSFDFWHDRLRSFARLHMPDDGWQEWCVGTFHLTTNTTAHATAAGDSMRSVSGFDSLVVLTEDAVLDRYVVAAGEKYVTAVRVLLASSGFATSQIEESSLALPAAREWAPGTSKLSIVNELLSAINYRSLIMTAYGVPASSKYRAPADEPPTWTYAVDRRSVMLPGVDVELDLFDVPNAWIAVVSEPDRPELKSVLVNDDPESMLSTVSRGRTVVLVLGQDHTTREDNIEASATQEVLDEKVAQAAAAASQQYEVASFSTGLMPFHGSGDVALLDYGLGPLRFREHEWSMQLKAGGTMSHKYRRVVQL